MGGHLKIHDLNLYSFLVFFNMKKNSKIFVIVIFSPDTILDKASIGLDIEK